jgi:N-carbamoyl-L-amino-acid hydrolase
MLTDHRIDATRLLQRLDDLAQHGAREDGGVSRLALTDADKAGRDQVVTWMRALGLEVTVDAIGNIHGLRAGRSKGPPVMTGSHIDTVRAGGRYDGNYGVLAGLEVVETLNDAGLTTEHPLCVSVFTGEEGARFAPDMLGSLVFVGALALETALAIRDAEGCVLGEELARIGYAGDTPVGHTPVHRYVELHIEQGPVLEAEGVTIGAVRDLQGISWQELELAGQANHAGTTPMQLRHDAGYAAAAVATFLRELTKTLGGDQLATCGVIELQPNLINVIPSHARMTVDLRNTDEASLQRAEAELARFLAELQEAEGVTIATRRLARFEPVVFDADVHAVVRRAAEGLGYSVRDMTSGAGHDAQMLARICPSAMIFVPSVGGISHNPAEHTEPAELEAGANVLLRTMLELDAQS